MQVEKHKQMRLKDACWECTHSTLHSPLLGSHPSEQCNSEMASTLIQALLLFLNTSLAFTPNDRQKNTQTEALGSWYCVAETKGTSWDSYMCFRASAAHAQELSPAPVC